MEFINILLQHSSLRQAKLYSAARKAAENPAIGITIQNKAAYHVIKDCAVLATYYLPHFVFGSYEAPFETLKGKFKKNHIVELITTSETNATLKQLVWIMVQKAKQQKASKKPPTVISSQPKEDLSKINLDDPYGDYGLYTEEPSVPNIQVQEETELDILCNAFGVLD